jgi:hypothetical protein
MLKFVAIFAAVAVTASLALARVDSQVVDTEFARFIKQYERAYSTPEEFAERKAIFAGNLDALLQRSADEAGGMPMPAEKVTYTKFMDWSIVEKKKILAAKRSSLVTDTVYTVDPEVEREAIAKAGDKLGAQPTAYLSAYRTNVKNQASCGSCWAFTLTACIEARYMRNNYIKYPNGDSYSLSPQQFVSCYAKNCEGQYLDQAGTWAVNRYLSKLSVYPYSSGGGTVAACRSLSTSYRSTSMKTVSTTRSSVSYYVYYQEAVSIVIGVCPDFYDYSWSCPPVYSCKCATSSYDGYHAMTIVGYNVTSSGQFFWTVKNSWSKTGWGRDGYLLLADSSCSMYMAPSSFLTFYP